MIPLAYEFVAGGLAIGIVLGATGAGGAILSVPLLTLFYALNIQQAAPIGLFAVAVASGLASFLGLREGIVRYKAGLLMAGAGMLCTPLGLWVAQRVPNEPLVLLFAALLLWVGWRMWHNNHELTHDGSSSFTEHDFICERSDVSGKFIWTLPCARILALTGMLAGFLSGLIGVGGGFIIVPSLKQNTNLDMRSIVATSLTVICLVSVTSVALAAGHGLVDWALAVPFALGTVGGMLFGKRLGRHVSLGFQARSFAVLACLAAGLMVFKLL